MNYQIIRSTYYDEYGNGKDTYYYIKQRKHFLSIPYWKDITHRECYAGDISYERTKFSTEHEANQFIKEVLCKDKKTSNWVETLIKEIDC
jgi:hypothetical protein